MTALQDLEKQVVNEISYSQYDDSIFEYECLHEQVRDKLVAISDVKGIEPDAICKEESTRMTQKYAIDFIDKLEEAGRLICYTSAFSAPSNLTAIPEIPAYDAGDYYQVITSHFIRCIDQLLAEIDHDDICLTLCQAKELMLEIRDCDKEFDLTDNEYTRAVDALYKEVIE